MASRKICLLSMENTEGFFIYDELLVTPFARAGIEAVTLPWNTDTDWSQFEAVIVRSTWDYQHQVPAFLHALKKIRGQGPRILNGIDTIGWNVSKHYLHDLACKGVPCIPTLWQPEFNLAIAHASFAAFATTHIVIKPQVSANADDTFLLDADTLHKRAEELSALFTGRGLMIQPCIPSVIDKGEVSLFYFGGQYSHGILKTPKAGDFRVQEEHGGRLQSYPPEDDLLALAEQALAEVPEPTLYARVDIAFGDKGPLLMELELIEPSLYFTLDQASPQRFVDAYLAMK